MSREHRKAQAAMEFMVMVGIALVIFLALYAIANAQARSGSEAQFKFAEKQVCNEFATTVNLVYTSGNGFTAYMDLPDNIKGRFYELRITNKTVRVVSGDKVVFCDLITNDLNYANPVNNGDLEVTNINGTVHIQ